MKSNNPFKMWGSWIGAIIPIISYFITKGSCDFYYPTYNPTLCPIMWLTSPYPFGIFQVIPMGFLIGWGIESLIRRFK